MGFYGIPHGLSLGYLLVVLDLHVSSKYDSKCCIYTTSIKKSSYFRYQSWTCRRFGAHRQGTPSRNLSYLHRVGRFADEDGIMTEGVKNVLLLLGLR